MSTITGRILKNYNGYYYVVTEAGQEYTCKVKGKLKQKRFSLATGDCVEVEIAGGGGTAAELAGGAGGTDAGASAESQGAAGASGSVANVSAGGQASAGVQAAQRNTGEGMITTILPRKNFLPRPTVANLDLFVLTMACATPDFSYLIADKLLLLAEQARIPAILVLNKIDLVAPEAVEQIASVYRNIGYEVYPIAARTGAGVEALRQRISGRICVLGGPSGVGKSSTLNALDPTVALRTGQVSEKIGRGKHTTRYAQLVPFAGGYLADTPGFGNLYVEGLGAEEVPLYFREFREYEQGCKFCPCSHTHEPVCGVKDAVAAGRIAHSRYASYVSILEELEGITASRR